MGRTHAPRVQLLVASLALAAGCKGERETPAEPDTPAETAQEAPGPTFVYEPTLRKVVPPDIAVSMVMEVELPGTGELYILAAVAREQPRLELHHFDTVEGIVQPDGEAPVQLVRVRADDVAFAELGTLRRRFNAPGSTRRRPVGLDVDSPGDLVDALTTAHAEFEGGSHEAIATIMRGYSDAIVFEQDAVPEAFAALRGLGEFETEMQGERRAKLVGKDGTVECHRQSGGWVVFSY